MSRIRVWTSEGKWSKEVVGMDKVDLMERALLLGMPKTSVYDENGEEMDTYTMDGFTYNGDESIKCKKTFEEDWGWFTDNDGHSLRFADIQSFQMPFQILEALKKDTEYPYLSAVYDELIKAAEIPAGFKVKSVMLIFHEEA